MIPSHRLPQSFDEQLHGEAPFNSSLSSSLSFSTSSSVVVAVGFGYSRGSVLAGIEVSAIIRLAGWLEGLDSNSGPQGLSMHVKKILSLGSV